MTCLTLVRIPDPIVGRIGGKRSRHDQRKQLATRLHVARLNYYRTPTAAYKRLVERAERALRLFDSTEPPEAA